MVLSQALLDLEQQTEARAEFRGEQTIVLRLLKRKVGYMPEHIHEQIISLNAVRLRFLADALLDFRSINSLNSWLEANQPSFNQGSFQELESVNLASKEDAKPKSHHDIRRRAKHQEY
jgi:Domain of unknown function (DUF4351)